MKVDRFLIVCAKTQNKSRAEALATALETMLQARNEEAEIEIVEPLYILLLHKSFRETVIFLDEKVPDMCSAWTNKRVVSFVDHLSPQQLGFISSYANRKKFEATVAYLQSVMSAAPIPIHHVSVLLGEWNSQRVRLGAKYVPQPPLELQGDRPLAELWQMLYENAVAERITLPEVTPQKKQHMKWLFDALREARAEDHPLHIQLTDNVHALGRDYSVGPPTLLLGVSYNMSLCTMEAATELEQPPAASALISASELSRHMVLYVPNNLPLDIAARQIRSS